MLENNACGFVGIYVSNNGDQWVVGYDEKDTTSRPLRVTTTAGDTKQDLMEATNNILTMTRIGREMSRQFTGVIPIV